MGCNPAAVFELYPVVAVSSAVDAFAICVAGDISKKASKFKGFWGIVLFRTCIRDPELAVKKGTAR